MPSKRCLTQFRRVFSSLGSFPKSNYMYGTIGVPHSLLALRDVRIHNTRRAIVNPMFSQKSINTLASMVQDNLEKLIHIMRRHYLEGKPTDIQTLYRCLSV